jgi:GTP1/Obg family GTP-binding protein
MGFFTRKKKKLAFEKTYPVLVDLAVYINDLKDSLQNPQFIANLSDETIKKYINGLHENKNKNSYFTKSRGIETINTLNDALVELAINIKAFQEELSKLPEVNSLTTKATE